MALVLSVIVIALVFEYINGFHDTANAVATSVATRVMTPAQAITLSAVMNLVGAMAGVAVAKTIGQGLVETQYINSVAMICALTGAITWNLITWYVGLPSSSSHALIGGLCGAALGAAQGSFSAIKWAATKVTTKLVLVPAPKEILDSISNFALQPGTNTVTVGANSMSLVVPATGAGKIMMLAPHTVVEHTGLLYKVIIPMFVAPTMGIVIGFLIMGLLLGIFRNSSPHFLNKTFGKIQWLSAAWMSFEHGHNDAQKTMGLITLTLYTATQSGVFKDIPSTFEFLKTPTFEIAFWVKLICAIAIAAGTAGGGWRIIKTMGKHVFKMMPIHGFAAQTTAATVIGIASVSGIPLSTTHVIAGSIMGVGATKRLNAVKWTVAEQMLWAWVFTLPASGGVAYLCVYIARAFNFM
ncbi:MAG: anion permease [Verrucomicrobiia bacterium]